MKNNIEIIVAVIVMFLIGINLGIAYSNMTTKQALNNEADELLTSCEEDGLLNCQIKWKYHNGVIVGVSSTGERGE